MVAEQLTNIIAKCPAIKPDATIVVGVSGGADSMALVLLLDRYMRSQQGKVIAVTIDHQLRPESAVEAALVGKWMQHHAIDHHIVRVTVPETKNTQAAAREARYEALVAFCQQVGATCLCVAHHLEDQAETVMMRLMRGSGVDGLSGMEEVTTLGEVTLVRPLLNTSKQTLCDFLRSIEQDWIRDPSNDNDQFERVRVRKWMEQQQDSALLVQRMADTASNMRRVRDYLESHVADANGKMVTYHDAGYCQIELDSFAALHPEIAYRLLSTLLCWVSGEYYKPRFEALQRCYGDILKQKDVTLQGCQLMVNQRYNMVYVFRELAAIGQPITYQGQDKVIWDQRFCCDLSSMKENGLVIDYLGHHGYQQLGDHVSSGQVSEIPKKIIYSLPVIKNLENILAIPHIGYYSEHNSELEGVSIELLRKQPI